MNNLQTRIDNAALLERVLAGYLECAAWTDSPEGSHARFPKAEKAAAGNLCAEFIRACGALFEQAIAQPWYTPERFGHDFWLSRCGHGTGYWDREELEVGAEISPRMGDIPPSFIDRDGKTYAPDQEPAEITLGEALHALAYGTHSHISRFAYPSLTTYRGWLYFH